MDWHIRTRELLIKAIVPALSAVASLTFAEVWLQTTTGPERFLDERTDRYWKALRGPSMHQAIEGRDTVSDPELGWRMRPLFESVGVRHNSRGFRGEREYLSKPGTSRILAIGDSFTYGLGVADEATYSTYLEQATGIEVVNAGVNAYGVDQALLMWEIEGKQIRPTHVILGYFIDDFVRNELSYRDAPKPRFIFNVATQKYDHHPPKPDGHGNSSDANGNQIFWTPLKVPQAFAWLVRRVRSKTGFLDEEWLESAARTSEYLLKRLHESVTQSGARLLIIVIGHPYDGLPEHNWIEKSIINTCRSNGFECLNLAAARRVVDATPLYGPNGHFSEEGHRFAARNIAATLGFSR